MDLLTQLLAEKTTPETTVPSDDGLKRVRDIAEEVRRKTKLRDDKTAEIEELDKDIFTLQTKTLPDVMKELRIPYFGLEDGSEVSRGIQIYANISADWDPARRETAFSWLRDNGHGDLIKNEYKVPMGRGMDTAAAELKAFLSERKLDFTAKEAVAFQTLTKLVTQLHESGADVPLDVLGAFVQDLAKITPPKAEKKKKASK